MKSQDKGVDKDLHPKKRRMQFYIYKSILCV